MGTQKAKSSGMDVRAIGEALPPAHRRYRRAKPAAKPMPPSLPSCFEDVWRRRHSTEPADRRQRAALEAVASTIPSDAAGLTGQSAAAVYLAALVLSLNRLISTTTPAVRAHKSELHTEKPISRKERKKLRRKERIAEKAVQDMPAAAALGGKPGDPGIDATMNVDDVADGEGNQGTVESEEAQLIANLVYLVGLAARGSSQAVLNTKCETVLHAVMAAYDHVARAAVVARHTSHVFAAVLAVLDSSSWSKPGVQRAYLYLLSQTFDLDPKSRRKARDALDKLLRSPRASIILARTSSAAATHFVSELKFQSSALDDAINGDTAIEGAANPYALIHLLTSVDMFFVFLSPPDVARISKELVLIAVKRLPSVTLFAFAALTSIFEHRDGAHDKDNVSSSRSAFLPQGDLGKLLHALLGLDIQDDIPQDTAAAFNMCISKGAIAYASTHQIASPPDEFIIRPVKKLCDALDPAIGKNGMSRIICSGLRELLTERWFCSRPAILSILHSFTANAYRLLWADTTPLLKSYIEFDMTAGKLQLKDEVNRMVKTVVAAREKATSSTDKKMQDMASGVLLSLVRGGGTERILSFCELRYDKKMHLTNAWLLPVLRSGLCGAPLSLFTSKLVPITEQLKGAMKNMEQGNRPVEYKNLEMYLSQIWGLLPGFCHKPSDLGHNGIFNMAFKAIHYCLSSSGHPSLYLTGVRALRQLSDSLLALDSEDETSKARRQSFGGRLKKLFPTIVEITENAPDDKRGQLLEAVTMACRATGDSLLVSNMLRKSIRRLLELQLVRSKGGASVAMEEDQLHIVRQQHCAADIAIAITNSGFVPRGAAEIGFLEKAMTPFFLDAKESSLQKKAYRATTLLVRLGSMEKAYDELEAFARNTANARTTVAPGAKAARLGLVAALVDQQLHLSAANKIALSHLVTDLFLPEVVLGTRDSSEKTRAAAFETLLAMARGWNSTATANDTSGLRQFFLAVAAGLGGKTVTMLAATLTSLGRLMYEFQGEAASDDDLAKVIDSLFASKVCAAEQNAEMRSGDEDDKPQSASVQPGPIAILLRHNAMEVQKSALGVVKVATKVLSIPPDRLINVLPGILPGLVYASARSKKQEMRLRVRVILERLLRRCGRDLLEASFPKDHLKLLAAVRKKYSRDLIKKHAAKDRKKEKMNALHEKEKVLQERSESEDSDGFDIDDSDSDIERELLDGDEMRSVGKKTSRSAEGRLRMHEKEGHVMDLLDSRNAHSVFTEDEMKETSQFTRRDQKRSREDRKEDEFKYTDDGRPIFVESDEESGNAEMGSDVNDDFNSDSESDGLGPKKRSGTGAQKRQRGDPGDAARHSKKTKGSFGEEFRSRKGKGDVKRPGRPDPYAYIPLGASLLGSTFRPGAPGSKGSSLQRLASSRAKKGKRRGVPGKR